MNLAVIPARKGSKGLNGKNIFQLGGRPLVDYTIEAARQSTVIDKIVVTTDIPQMIDICLDNRVECIMRDEALCGDDVPLAPVIIDALISLQTKGWQSYTNVITLQPTSPFRTGKHIDDAYSVFCEVHADSLVSVKEERHSIWTVCDGAIVSIANPTKNRQFVEPYYIGNGAIMITNRSMLLESQSRVGGKVALYVMDDVASLDVHTIDDINLAEHYLRSDQ